MSDKGLSCRLHSVNFVSSIPTFSGNMRNYSIMCKKEHFESVGLRKYAFISVIVLKCAKILRFLISSPRSLCVHKLRAPSHSLRPEVHPRDEQGANFGTGGIRGHHDAGLQGIDRLHWRSKGRAFSTCVLHFPPFRFTGKCENQRPASDGRQGGRQAGFIVEKNHPSPSPPKTQDRAGGCRFQRHRYGGRIVRSRP